jgi:hypothetical protein
MKGLEISMKESLQKLQKACDTLVRTAQEFGDFGSISTCRGDVLYRVTEDGKYEIELNGRKILYSVFASRCPLGAPQDSFFVKCEDWDDIIWDEVPILTDVENYILLHFLGSVALIYFSHLTPEGLDHFATQIEKL